METKRDFIEKILSINPNYSTETIELAYDVAERLRISSIPSTLHIYLQNWGWMRPLLSVGFCMTL